MQYDFPGMNKLYMIFISKSTSYIPCLVKHGNVSDVIYISRVKNLQKFTKKLLVTTSQYKIFDCIILEIWRGWDSNPRTPKRKDILYDDLESFSVDRASIPSNERDYGFLHITSSVCILSDKYRKII